jgi:peptidoglycan/xylan/chitin deacetylase (PgdA/CDA1 family)
MPPTAAPSTTDDPPMPSDTAPEASTDDTDPGTAPTTDIPVAEGDPNPSGLPEPGAGGVARPSGAAGGLEVLNWAGYKGAVSYSFDDSNSSQLSHFDEMLALEVPFTFYMQTGKPEAGNEAWGKALAAGHEIGNHTKSHQSQASGGDIEAATTFIQDTFDTTPYTMAAPNGDQSYKGVSPNYFLINRGVSGAQIKPNSSDDKDNLGSYVTPPSPMWNVQNFNSTLDSSRSGGSWHIVCIHGFVGGSDSAYGPVQFQDWVDGVNYAKMVGDVWIGTVVNVGAYWQGQKAVSAAQAQDGADGQTYTWMLPNHFPPGRYLRVTVTGGTPMQDGAALPWNEHGFYEIALDSGSVTIAP